ncbi:MAG: hypothetical protein EA377_11355 [Phycisphaerales bacterium]|nr:MAG: hypothetical protein EA377_11355 [Phycisphaerales bacterium]
MPPVGVGRLLLRSLVEEIAIMNPSDKTPSTAAELRSTKTDDDSTQADSAASEDGDSHNAEEALQKVLSDVERSIEEITRESNGDQDDSGTADPDAETEVAQDQPTAKNESEDLPTPLMDEQSMSALLEELDAELAESADDLIVYDESIDPENAPAGERVDDEIGDDEPDSDTLVNDASAAPADETEPETDDATIAESATADQDEAESEPSIEAASGVVEPEDEDDAESTPGPENRSDDDPEPEHEPEAAVTALDGEEHADGAGESEESEKSTSNGAGVRGDRPDSAEAADESAAPSPSRGLVARFLPRPGLPFAALACRGLSVLNYPLRFLSPTMRSAVDWVAVTLVFWVPIVWFLVWFTTG